MEACRGAGAGGDISHSEKIRFVIGVFGLSAVVLVLYVLLDWLSHKYWQRYWRKNPFK